MAKKKLIHLDNPANLSMCYQREMRVRGQAIYVIVLLTIASVLLALPLIHVDVSVRGGGLLQVPIERNQIALPVTGKVSRLNIRENGYVHQGDTLLMIDASIGQEHDRLLSVRMYELQQLITDAQKLTSLPSTSEKSLLITQRYISSWEQYSQQLENTKVQLDFTKREHDRFESLYNNRVVSTAEFERYQSAWRQASSAFEGVSKQFRSQWAAEATSYRSELHELSRQRAEWKGQESFYTITAPLSGTIQNLVGLQSGSQVFANQIIAEISPDSSLIAVVYISPKDVGLVRKGQETRIQIDAYNYNQWGMVTAVVEDISDDMVLDAHNQPMFRVKCVFENTTLTLSNGYEGELKKGLTFQARFLVARRTLFQLLYDKIDDWLNPNIA